MFKIMAVTDDHFETPKRHIMTLSNNIVNVSVGAVFITKPHNVTAMVGDNVTLRCDAEGDWPISVSWNLNGKDLNHYEDDRLA